MFHRIYLFLAAAFLLTSCSIANLQTDDLAEVTITDFFLPMPGGMKNATVRFPNRTQTSIGAWLPTQAIIQLGHPKENLEKDVYTINFRNYRFDGFAREVLYPLEGVAFLGDAKLAGE